MKFEGGGKGSWIPGLPAQCLSQVPRGARLLPDWPPLDDDHRDSIFSLQIIVFSVVCQFTQSRCCHHDHLRSQGNDDADGYYYNNLRLADTPSFNHGPCVLFQERSPLGIVCHPSLTNAMSGTFTLSVGQHSQSRNTHELSTISRRGSLGQRDDM